MALAIPTCSSAGWVSGLSEKADRALSYAFVSQQTQSNMYKAAITSIPYLIQNNSGDHNALVLAVQDSLERYLGRYYEGVVVTVSAKAYDVNKPSELNLSIQMQVTEDGQVQSVGRLAYFFDGKLKNIVALNNYGTEV